MRSKAKVKRKWAPEEIEAAREKDRHKYNDPPHEWRESDRVGDIILSEDELLSLPFPEESMLWPSGTMFRDKDGTVWEWVRMPNA